MIPEFDENGNLPPGVHFCEWEEFVDRFGYNDTRTRLINGLQMAMEQLQAAGCRTIFLNSYLAPGLETGLLARDVAIKR